MTLTPNQLHILQHSLGCDQYGRGTNGWPHDDEGDGHFGYYRNHYVCDPEPDLIALVAAGFMRDHPPRELTGGMHCYTVTREGLAAMLVQSPKPPKRSRGQERYREFLRSDTGETFGEWLKRRSWNAKVEELRKLGMSRYEIEEWMSACYGKRESVRLTDSGHFKQYRAVPDCMPATYGTATAAQALEAHRKTIEASRRMWGSVVETKQNDFTD